jgi:hypothetical protein
MKCPVEGCNFELTPLEGFTERERLLYHLSAVARDALKLEPHEEFLYGLKKENKECLQ